jgi:hypothetical protein
LFHWKGSPQEFVSVDVDVLVLVDMDGFFKSSRVKHTPENVKPLMPPRQSRGISQRIRDKPGRVEEYQDVTFDQGEPDKRLLVTEPEFASALRVMGRDGNTLSAIIREAWDTGDLNILNKNSPVKATDARVSIIGHVTHEELRRYLDRTELANGFANRFLWICVKRSKLSIICFHTSATTGWQAVGEL